MSRPISTYLHEFICITSKTSNKQHVSKRSCSNEILWAKLKMHSQPEYNINKVRRGKVKYEVFSEVEILRSIMPYLFQIFSLTAEV